MKRSLGNSDSLGSLITICPSTTEEQSPRNNMYTREFQSMLEGLDEEGCVEETGHHHSEKKRRLSVEQVKALEKNFDVENKLEPERKMKLAQELGLQPRQVAVWFQNRRARWKTKNLERDYGVLKANYDAVTLNHDALKQDNEALLKKIKELKSKLQEEDINPASDISVKEEITMMPHGSENKMIEHCKPSPEASNPGSQTKDRLNYGCINNNSDGVEAAFKEGASDSDTSAILNEDNNRPKVIDSSSGILQSHHQLFMPHESSSTSSMNCFEFQKSYQSTQYVKMEEHSFLSAEEACNFFSDEQAPTLLWCSSEPVELLKIQQ